MRIIHLIATLIIFSSCQNKNTFLLSYTGFEKEEVYLFKFINNQPVKIDSSFNKNKHNFEINAPTPELFLVGNSINKSVLFIAENKLGNSITSNDTSSYNFSVSGDSTNIILQQYFNQKNKIIIELQKLAELSGLNDSEKSIQIMNKHKNFIRKFIKKNSTSPAILMVLGELNNPLEFKDELLIIKEVIETKYKNNDFLNEVNRIIQSGKQQEQMLNQQRIMQEEEEAQKKLLGIELGAAAPDINLLDPSGKRIKLSSLKNKVVLLDFWASWCRPCRAENPNLVKLYQKYKNKNFTVYSVSLDKNKDKWTEAIKQDQLNWSNHVSELQGWNSSAGTKYGVTSIPKTFLINKKGEIVGFNLRGNELEEKIAELILN
jgi:thiol-disulfide isomerase/thioredoxin